jgi:hypothetical protein
MEVTMKKQFNAHFIFLLKHKKILKKQKELACHLGPLVQLFSANLARQSFGQTEGHRVTASLRNWRFSG